MCPVVALNHELWFPPQEWAEPDGLLAVGGDLSPERLILAYKSGIFPWFEYEKMVFWYSTNPRLVLYPDQLKISKSMKQVLKKQQFKVTFDSEFERVIRACSEQPRADQEGTWINDNFMESYIKLHSMGYAHSVEVWDEEEELVGGLYGIALGKVFSGESMFARKNNASKVGFITLVQHLAAQNLGFIDCQSSTAHLLSLGATEIPRYIFLKQLKEFTDTETLKTDLLF